MRPNNRHRGATRAVPPPDSPPSTGGCTVVAGVFIFIFILLAVVGIALVDLPARMAVLSLFGGQSDWQLLYVVSGDLWETNGSQATQLTHNGHLGQPTLASQSQSQSEAQSLIYVEREKNYSDLWLVDANHPARPITHDSSPIIEQNHWAAQPVFIPDSQRLLFLSDHNKESTGVGDLAVWELDLQQGTFTQITHPPAYTGGDQDISVNPKNGREIVFTRYVYGDSGQLTEELAWLDLGTNIAVALTASEHPSRQASFSPDGHQLAFVQTVGQAENLFVSQIDRSASKPRLVGAQSVATGMIAEPIWRPDGKEIAYIGLVNRHFQLFTVSVDRSTDGKETFGRPQQVTNGSGLDATSRPVWLTSSEARSLPEWLNRPS